MILIGRNIFDKPWEPKKPNHLHQKVSSKLPPRYGKYDEQSEFPV